MIQIFLGSDVIWQSYGAKTGKIRQKIVILGQWDEVRCVHAHEVCVHAERHGY